MPSFLRNGSFLFVLQSQPFYQAQLLRVTTISIREAQLELKTKSAILLNATCTYNDRFHLGSLARLEGEVVCLSRAVHRRSLKRGLVYEEWIHFLTKKRLYTWMNENEEIYQVVCWICLLLSTYHIAKLSTMTQDAMVYKVSSCFFFMVIFCF